MVKLCKSYEPPKLQDNIMLGFQENTLKFLGENVILMKRGTKHIMRTMMYHSNSRHNEFLCAFNDSLTQKCFKYALITLLINLCNWGDQKKFMNHSFSYHPKPFASLVLLHKTKNTLQVVAILSLMLRSRNFVIESYQAT